MRQEISDCGETEEWRRERGRAESFGGVQSGINGALRVARIKWQSLCADLVYPYRSLLYVDADARMETYTDGEGNKRSNLSLIASEFPSSHEDRTAMMILTSILGNFEVISRPKVEEVDVNEEGVVQEASG